MPQLRGLRRARERRFVTIAELAERAGVGPSTIVNLELHGQEARMSTARKLAQALGCTPGELLGEEAEGSEQGK
jgi:transcriptional regulator with XRE-family HTH domain